MDTKKIKNKGKTKIIAHRGLSGIELENTTGAFVAAGNRSYFGIETDVHKTSDDEYVVIHDDVTDRVSDEKLPIESSMYSELRKVKLGHTDNDTARADRVIPNLKEYISICKTYDKIAVLELKNHFKNEYVKKLIEIISGEDYLENMIFISFDFENLLSIREIVSDANVQFLCREYNDELVKTLVQHNMDVDIWHKNLTGGQIKSFQNHGIKVNVWVVDDIERANELIGYGVDYLTTNILE